MQYTFDLLRDAFTHAHPAAQATVLIILLAVLLVLGYFTVRNHFRVRELKVERDRLRNDVREQQAEARAWKATGDDARSRADALQARIDELTWEQGRLRQQLEDATTRLEDVQALYGHCRDELTALQKRFQDLQNVDTNVWLSPPAGGPLPRFVPRTERRARFVAVLNLKGGVGKTTLTANLAAAYATGVTGHPLDVLAIDLDYQGTLSNMCVSREFLTDRRREYNRNTSECLLDDRCLSAPAQEVLARLLAPVERSGQKAWVVVADEHLEHVDFRQQAVFLAQGHEVRFHYRRVLHAPPVSGQFDYVFFDCPPRLTTSAINALAAADFVVVPTGLHPNDTDAVPRTLQWLERLRGLEAFQARLAGVVLNRTYRGGTTADVSKDEAFTLERLRLAVQRYEPTGGAILEPVVPNKPDVARYAAGSIPLGCYPEGHAIYRGVAVELDRRMRA